MFMSDNSGAIKKYQEKVYYPDIKVKKNEYSLEITKDVIFWENHEKNGNEVTN